MRLSLRRAEAIVAILLSIAAVFLHYLATSSAGALWRDEANTVGLATLPTLPDVWHNLQYDSFPILWILIVRSVASLGGSLNDPAFRTLGFVIGLALVGALWVNARAFRISYPLLSLALFSLNPSVIRWGDSFRAYGLGMTLAVLMGVSAWRFVEVPDKKRLVAFAIASLVSVHTLYYNAPVVFAFCAAGAVVAVTNRQWRTAAAISIVGILSAASLLIYVPVIQSAATWNSLVTIRHYDFRWFFLKLDETFLPLGRWATTIWIFAFLIAIWAAVSELILNRLRLTKGDGNAILFAVVAMTVGAFSLYAFLRMLSYYTQPWYYLILLTITAICIEIVFAKLSVARWACVARLGVVMAIASFSIIPSALFLRARMTNVDIVARSLKTITEPNDRVVLAPWYIGVSFSRYYTGRAPWIMLPSVKFSRFHRYDLFMTSMLQSDQKSPAREVIDPATSALKNGGSIYIVSDARHWQHSNQVTILGPAAIPKDGWRSPAYQSQWMSLFEAAIRRHAISISTLPLPTAGGVNEYEDLSVTRVTGWRQ